MNAQVIASALEAYYQSKNRVLDDFSLTGFLKRVQGFDTVEVMEAIEEARFSEEFPDVTVPLKMLSPKSTLALAEKAQEQAQIAKMGVMFKPNPTYDDPITSHIMSTEMNVYSWKQRSQSDLDQFFDMMFMKHYRRMSDDPTTTKALMAHTEDKGQLLGGDVRSLMELTNKFSEDKEAGQ